MAVPQVSPSGAPNGEHPSVAELDQLAATMKDVRDGCHNRAFELDEIESSLVGTHMSGAQAAAVREAVQGARELGRRLLQSLDDGEIRLESLRQLPADQ